MTTDDLAGPGLTDATRLDAHSYPLPGEDGTM